MSGTKESYVSQNDTLKALFLSLSLLLLLDIESGYVYYLEGVQAGHRVQAAYFLEQEQITGEFDVTWFCFRSTYSSRGWRSAGSLYYLGVM